MRPRIDQEASSWWPGAVKEFRGPVGGPEWTRSAGRGPRSGKQVGFHGKQHNTKMRWGKDKALPAGWKG